VVLIDIDMKQKYYVNVHYDVVLRVEVVAGIEEDVLQLAIQKTEDMSLEDGEVCDIQASITSIEKY
jgi:hypothetical protein